MKDLVQMVRNYENNVDWIIKAYENAKGFVHGFQKDAIQNAMGARLSNKFYNWQCNIYLKQAKNKQYLIIEDKGTCGLTGPILDHNQITAFAMNNKNFSSDWRLIRFLSEHFSGENKTGGGLYGVGKTLYSAASSELTYYFDSIRYDDKKNIAGVVSNGNTLNQTAFSGKQAKDYIVDQTGLEPIDFQGTRIIIVNPKKEIVDAIKNKTIDKYISETWWRSIIKFDLTSSITVDGRVITVPKLYNDNNIKHSYKDNGIDLGDNYKIRKFEFSITKTKLSFEKGIYFYRKGMKIGEINLSNRVPKELDQFYFGYIELNNYWENEISKIEDSVHYGVDGNRKNSKAYSKLRNFVEGIVSMKLEDWGYTDSKNTKYTKIHKELDDIKGELEQLFNRLKIDEIGHGDKAPSFEVRFHHVKYPNENRIIYDNQVIDFILDIKNNLKTSRDFILDISCRDNIKDIHKKTEKSIKIQSASIESVHEVITINPRDFSKFEKNNIVITVQDVMSKKTIEKNLVFYYSTDEPKINIKDFKLLLNSCTFPRKNSKRINSNDSLENIKYTLSNTTSMDLDVILSISSHNYNNNADKICDILKKKIRLSNMSEKIISVPSIHFDKGTYENKLLKGIVEIRARIISKETIGDIEIGDVISEYKFKVFFNKNEKKGIMDAFDINTTNSPDNERRSWIEKVGNTWEFTLNIGHALYKIFEKNNFTYYYNTDQMIRGFVEMYIKDSNYQIIGLDNIKVENYENSKIVELIDKKVDEIYFNFIHDK